MNIRGLVLSCSVLALTAPAVAHAQADESAAAAAAEQAGEESGEIIVTAQKRSERLIDVPMSLAVVSGDQLSSAGVGSTLDLGQITPGVLMTNVGTGFTPSIRGVSSSGTSVGDESNVALYVDDVYVGNTLAGFFDLPDVERVEILKGPQGTLFGRNATGGAIKIVTRAPSFVPMGSASLDYGFTFNELKMTGYVSGPLGERVAASLSGLIRKSDGFTEGVAQNTGETYGGADNYTVRGKVLFEPTDAASVTVTGYISRNDNQSGAMPTAQGQNPYPGPGSVPNSRYKYAGGTDPLQLTTNHGATLDASIDLNDNLTLRSITAYQKFNLDYRVDLDRTSLPILGLALQADQDNFSEEINLFNDPNARISWLVGAFYYKSRASNPYFTIYLGETLTGAVLANNTVATRTSSIAGFADVTWNVSDKLHVTVGGRYTSETKKYHFEDIVRAGGLPLQDVRAEETWTSPTARGVIRYDFTPQSNVYVSLSNGFKSGVFNAFSPLPVPVDPEKIVALEVGAKTRLLGGPTLTVAGYAYNYDDMQVQSQTIFAGQPVLTLSNAASAKIRGVEFTASGRLFDGFSFNAGINWMPVARYDNYEAASITVPIVNPTTPVVGQQIVPYDASGSRLIKAPRISGNIQLTYTTMLADGELAITGSSAYTGKFNWQAAGFTEVPGYNIVNARVDWTDPTDRYTLSVWATNVTDVVYSTYTSANVRGNTQTFNQPRQIGIGISTRF